MVARFTGASMGLLAFTVSASAGLLVGNPLEVTLSRSILALFLFCLLGTVLGMAAQRVINEYEREGEARIKKQYRLDVPTGNVEARTMTEVEEEAATGSQTPG